MGVEVRDGLIYLSMTEKNILNLCKYMPEWKRKVWDELPNSVKDKLSSGIVEDIDIAPEEKGSYDDKTKSMLEYIDDGKTSQDILNVGWSMNLLRFCYRLGYVHRPRHGYYVVTDKGYNKLHDYDKKMSKSNTINMILKFLRNNPHNRYSSPELSRVMCLGANRCRWCMESVRNDIDSGILLNFKYKKLTYGGIRAFYVYWYEG